MKEFTELLNVKNKSKFTELYFRRLICYLRKDIYEHIISHEENDYFNFDIFVKDRMAKEDDELLEKLQNTIIKELKKLGWKCGLSFGKTGLFVYSTEKPPPSCWDDSL